MPFRRPAPALPRGQRRRKPFTPWVDVKSKPEEIETLPATIDAIETDLGAVEGDLLTVATEVNAVEADVTTLAGGSVAAKANQSALTTTNANVTALQTTVTDLQADLADASAANGTFQITSTTSSTTLPDARRVALVDASGGAVTITLPLLAGSVGHLVLVKKIETSANAVTVQGNGADLIDGAASYGIAGGSRGAVTLFAGTAEWRIV